jgi:hypothetical protein
MEIDGETKNKPSTNAPAIPTKRTSLDAGFKGILSSNKKKRTRATYKIKNEVEAELVRRLAWDTSRDFTL